MKIAVMGAGAVGSYFGAKLAKAGHEVELIARGEHLEKIRRNGLSVKSIDGDFHIYVKAVPAPSYVGECDLVIFGVKSYDTVEAASRIAPIVGKETVILSLQNGVDNEEKIAETIGDDNVIGGLCYVGARIDRPGEVIHSAAGRVIIGELDGRNTLRLAAVECAFREAEIPVRISDSIMVDKWKKLCWNISFNATSALTRATVGDMLDHAGARHVIGLAIAEAVAVANARGIALPADFPERVIADNEAYRDLKTSTLQDVEKRRRLEIDALNGVICRYGRVAGIPTPVNDVLYALVSCISPGDAR